MASPWSWGCRVHKEIEILWRIKSGVPEKAEMYGFGGRAWVWSWKLGQIGEVCLRVSDISSSWHKRMMNLPLELPAAC